ncbi:hypothetical protein [Streptomyces pakalii]|uniref:Uncharacterized protein n=1 Tax=Streptomyces pakalii TaxID=3036494 RepID=A0ABT7CZW3_9ACTN|nr:hypothetical protein [Streptomyces pakalii]MDJ1639008.1 hypothetical protein [Streptomyces pakalii]
MHHHGYLWTGSREAFDREGDRRPPSDHPPPPPTGEDDKDGHRLHQRYREAAAEFRTGGLPPIRTAHWLLKPADLVCGTWQEPEEAAAWLDDRLREYAPWFGSPQEQRPNYLSTLVDRAVERLSWGGDVSWGFYLARPSYVSLAVVTCSPNRAEPHAPCPSGHR